VPAFLIALTIVLVWAVTGPLFAFSDTWQLVINTGTTIVTFLMVFLIQNTQNRDSQALHAKLDELVIAMKGADNNLVEAEDLPDDQLESLKEHFQQRAHQGAATAKSIEEEQESRRKAATRKRTQARSKGVTARGGKVTSRTTR
jgi:low affinity Fe/Cu permease